MAMFRCCYLAKGAKRPSHTTNTIKFDRISFDPCNSIKRFDLCPFMDRPFLCGFCAAAEVADLQSKLAKITEKPQISGELSSLFNADSNQQYGRRDNVRIFGVEEAPNEDVYQAVIDVAEKAGCQVSRADISICHRVPSRNVKPGQGRPIIAKFVRRQTKIGLMTNKKKLKDSENKIYINDDLTLLRARLAKALRQRQDVTSDYKM